MRFKRCMFLTLILFLTIFSISFVVASENVTYDQNTGELNTLSMSDASPIRETSNTLAVDSIDEADYNSLGTDSEIDDEIEIDYNNETNLLRSSNDVEINNDDNIIGAENGKNILGAVNDLEIDNNSLIVLDTGNDLEILGASNDDNIIGAENDLEILGASNDEPVLGAAIDVYNQYGHDMDAVMRAILAAQPGDVLYLGGHTYSGRASSPEVYGHRSISNVRIVGGSYDGDPRMATFDSGGNNGEGIALTFRGAQQGGYYTIANGYDFEDVTFENIACTGRMFSFNSGSLTNCVFNNLESHEHLFFIYGCHEPGQGPGNPVPLTNCNFTNCRQTYSGPGNHHMDDGHGQLGVLFGAKLVGCNFINTSSANHGGAFCISDEYQGGG